VILDLKNGAINVYGRYNINKTQDLGFDVDYLRYGVDNDQTFENNAQEQFRTIKVQGVIFHRNSRFFLQRQTIRSNWGKTAKFEAGAKSSVINTDNTADYQLFNGSSWATDLKKSNHFRYEESINSLYSSIEHKLGKLSYQLGLRYENTNYTGNQLGNAVQAGSTFTKHYDNLFPSGYLTIQADSLNSFSFTSGRRIDRPAYQKLNPFVFIINKYTYQKEIHSFCHNIPGILN
jgi:iron complex outermembrane receptor protein